jgi:hypothetical protein
MLYTKVLGLNFYGSIVIPFWKQKMVTSAKEKTGAKIDIMAKDDVIMVKTTWRMPKPLLKQLKQYALDNDMTLTQVAMKAFDNLLDES